MYTGHSPKMVKAAISFSICSTPPASRFQPEKLKEVQFKKTLQNVISITHHGKRVNTFDLLVGGGMYVETLIWTT